MDILFKSAAFVLIIVFSGAAVAKFRDLKSVESGFDELGLPRPGLLSKAVPTVEALTAVALLVFTPWGATLAFSLLLGFTFFLYQLIKGGVTTSCNCFGATAGVPVSNRDLIRNGLLLGCAFLALFSPNIL